MARIWTRSALTCAVLGVLLGCSGVRSTGGPGASRHCGLITCQVTVTITDCTKPMGYTVSPDPLDVDTGGSPRQIQWTFDAASEAKYKFVSGSIRFKGSAAQSVFDSEHVTGNGKKYSLQDKKNDGSGGGTVKNYDYTVNVVSRDGSVTCGQFDPRISNF